MVASHMITRMARWYSFQRRRFIALTAMELPKNHRGIALIFHPDLIKGEQLGKTALDPIQTKLIDEAKSKIFDALKSMNEIANELVFKYPQHSARLFKQRTGMTPIMYRKLN
jgi:hypothetical protein